ncbi:MAG: hypothetical protein J5902_02840 [Paludibacteraceae bacterium]|nr:hypothetical protein [Paludibacteraceae bacterium]
MTGWLPAEMVVEDHFDTGCGFASPPMDDFRLECVLETEIDMIENGIDFTVHSGLVF